MEASVFNKELKITKDDDLKMKEKLSEFFNLVKNGNHSFKPKDQNKVSVCDLKAIMYLFNEHTLNPSIYKKIEEMERQMNGGDESKDVAIDENAFKQFFLAKDMFDKDQPTLVDVMLVKRNY